MSKINKLLFIIGILSLISLVIGWLLFFKTVNKQKNLDKFSQFLNHRDLPSDQTLNDLDANNNWDINIIMKKLTETQNAILNATTEAEAKDKKINFYHELVEIMEKMAPYQNKFNIQEKQFYDVQLPQITSEFLNTNYPIRYEILDKNIDPQKTKIEVNATYSKIINKFNQNDELVVKEYYVKTLNFEQLIRFNEILSS
ncbi:hypothetical protein [Candidatus Phytoplasma pyri]|uniref:hypothetical protein n=1 Tax=Candidatus Phytoplasma pyri TaxID=47566 RepID=UPI003982E83A